MDHIEITAEPPSETTFDKHAYKILVAAVVLVVGVASVVYHLLEDWSWVDSFYFSTVAVTTVGFGDLVPTTDTSKLFTILYIVVGIALIGTYLNVALRRRATMVASRRN
jgi:hypothetical protein